MCTAVENQVPKLQASNGGGSNITVQTRGAGRDVDLELSYAAVQGARSSSPTSAGPKLVHVSHAYRSLGTAALACSTRLATIV